MKRITTVVALLVATVLLGAAPPSALPATEGRQDDRIYSNSYKGKAPPELKSEKGSWINTKDKLKLKDLKGRVVWIEFSFLN